MAKKEHIDFIEDQTKEISKQYLIAYVKDGKLFWRSGDVISANGILLAVKEEIKFITDLTRQQAYIALHTHEQEEMDHDDSDPR